ncbi:hypothetical protein MVES_002259 [Malassezia vespertilionis]|uniref:Uncharacterized protein n=1 Tax=Malassezia vespertilionis TaxID=2020962 RepID=A0A2N1JBK5_9BASI|nr:hypothetical protein MVES_002259 [Malassezia vespertilionis]
MCAEILEVLLWSWLPNLRCAWGLEWNSDTPLPTDDYRQEAAQRTMEARANSKLADEEAVVSSGEAYPHAAPMAVPTVAATPTPVPAANIV